MHKYIYPPLRCIQTVRLEVDFAITHIHTYMLSHLHARYHIYTPQQCIQTFAARLEVDFAMQQQFGMQRATLSLESTCMYICK